MAKYLNIEPAAISKTVIKLEEKGFVERNYKNDKREKEVLLTEKTLEQYAIWEKAINNHRQSILIDLPEEKQHELYVMLKSIYSNTQSIKSNGTAKILFCEQSGRFRCQKLTLDLFRKNDMG